MQNSVVTSAAWFRACRRRIAVIAAASVLGASGQTRPNAAPAAGHVIQIDGRDGGRIFDGVGGVSAGASTRLLFDYPEPYRRDVLDYLFKPNYGAGLQILKVEIGGDMNSTDGSEPSHQRARNETPNFERGYEWWLMREAKARNPNILLAALEWGAPGWMKPDVAGKSAFWSEDNIRYIIGWLDGANRHGLKIDYIGGWNERGFDAGWYVKLAGAVKAEYPGIKIIAADDLPQRGWQVIDALVADPKFRAAVDIVGEHSPGGWRSLYEKFTAPAAAQRLGKPLWVSEQSSMSHDVAGGAWARGLNRAYIDAGITASLNWAPVSAWYANLPLADTGLILAEWPWSGHYSVGSTVWVHAHTTQFARPQWRYIDNACGYLPGGGSYVTLQAPHTAAADRDFSVIVETMDATEPIAVQFATGGGLSQRPVQVWRSNLATAATDDDFVHAATVRPAGGVFAVTLQPGHLYSLSTTTGQCKGNARPPHSAFAAMSLPFVEDFERYPPGRLARYFSDLNGGFETAPAGGGRAGMVYRQVVCHPPIAWRRDAGGPATMVGDPRWWGDYEVSTDVLLEQPGQIELIARIAAQARSGIAGYHLQLSTRGTWRLYSQDLPAVREADEDIASGEVPFAAGAWHTVCLRLQGQRISVVVDGRMVGSLRDDKHVSGNIALAVGDWQYAQFDNIRVTPTAPAPQFVPQADMAIVATSEHTALHRGDVFKAGYAIDGRPESFWHTRLDDSTLPQSLTLDLGRLREVQAIAYQPRLDNAKGGMITRYRIALSADGRDFSPVASGEWRISSATKLAQWSKRPARFVRLEVTAAVQDAVCAGEINVATMPLIVE